MVTVFHPLNAIEAHLVKILLIGEGIEPRVIGDHLQGAMGELPALGTMRVQVCETDERRARAIIEEWWQNRDDEDDSWIPPGLR
ncbi:MAG TPA: DUF2007 domain-containing protein [Chromatiaceae bacterium]|nr:DUF2007 domain-containing protein [Chromatiaceae bacterium]